MWCCDVPLLRQLEQSSGDQLIIMAGWLQPAICLSIHHKHSLIPEWCHCHYPLLSSQTLGEGEILFKRFTMQCIMATINNNIQQNDKDTTGTCACMHVCKLQFLTILVLLARIVGHMNI